MAYTIQKVKEKYIPKSTRLLDQVRETFALPPLRDLEQEGPAHPEGS